MVGSSDGTLDGASEEMGKFPSSVGSVVSGVGTEGAIGMDGANGTEGFFGRGRLGDD